MNGITIAHDTACERAVERERGQRFVSKKRSRKRTARYAVTAEHSDADERLAADAVALRDRTGPGA